MQPIVVTAAILVREGRVLLAQRREGAKQGLKWEFPGGKVEDGETPEQTLERELMEELGVKTRTGRIYDAKIFEYPSQKVLVLFYFSTLIEGEPQPIDANGLEWVTRDKIMDHDFAAADVGVAERLFSETGALSPWKDL